jgi:hypothetical protein
MPLIAIQSSWLLPALVSALTGPTDVPAADADRIYDGLAEGDLMGRAVALIGDLDGDGKSEYAVASRGTAAPDDEEGKVTVYSGDTGLPISVLNGENPLDQFGASVAGAGDVDNDGVPDLVVGAWGNSAGGSTSGRAYIYSAATGSPIYTITGSASGDNLGTSVAGAGDVNNDGHDDVVIGSPTNDNVASNAGLIQVISGFDGSVLHAISGSNTNDRLGNSVAGVGDVNDDGFADFAAGAHLFDDGGSASDNRGQIKVYSGEDGGLLYSLTGEDAGDNFGWAVAGVGDSDGDTLPDIAIGAPLYDGIGANNSGRVYLVSGPDGAPIEIFTGDATSDKLGLRVSAAGDADGDGRADVLSGAWWWDEGDDPTDNRGKAWIWSGRTGDVLCSFTGESADDHLGRYIAGGEDVNGDGTPDVLIAARDSDAFADAAGRAYLFVLPSTECLADVNHDGMVTPTDFTAWINAFNNTLLECDQNSDGSCTPTDFTAWISNFNIGC